MAVTNEQKPPWGSVRGPHVLAVYLLGLVVVFVGERLIGGQGTSRWVTSAIGAILVLAASATWLVAWLRSAGDYRRVERLAALLSLGGVLALLIYLLGSDLVMGPVPLGKVTKEIGLRQLMAVAWPIILCATGLPLVFLQVSVFSMASGRGVEMGRVYGSANAGAITAVFLSSLFLINAIADRKDVHTDLSYFKTTSPSDASRSMIGGLDKDTQALLFFPRANDVLTEVQPYFEELGKLSPRFEVRVVDRALEPELAREHRVSGDGTVLLIRGEAKQKITLGARFERAKRRLRKLDSEFQEKMLKLNRRRNVVYLITGHGERGPDKVESDVRPRILTLKKFLMALNMTVKHLGPVEGLASRVPVDAALLIWVDPSGELYPGEAEAINTYLDGGGRMLIALDTDSQGAANDVLAHLGLGYHPVKLAHDKAFIPLERSPADHYNLVTASFSSHPSVDTVSHASRRFPVLFPTSGYLEKTSGVKGKKVVFTVRSLPRTWADADGDMQRSKEEISRVFQLAAAVSMKIEKPEEKTPPEAIPAGKKRKDDKASPAGDAKDSKEDVKGKKDKELKKKNVKKAPEPQEEMRVVVLADSDVLSDRYLGFRLSYSNVGGNMQLLADGLKWLVGEDKVPGLPTSEEDRKIVHTRDEDTILFYGTVFAIPLLILAIGALTRWGRGRKRRAV